ncbi:T9SS type B sorting domain-containing protein [Aquimarina intermedia]|uniref:Gliding motility-associated-like protein n=1 Tax=Aquimarina intermedia TaxID=350814 RepID=A0A5S5CC07_9FLAO|nr:T9SS type B sorting domain-containing protein [Aquimarina intermedia]TYP76895.1 gliding motility-associated-like protein [Aquimarina intermedia]
MKTIVPIKIVLVMFLVFASTISNIYAQEIVPLSVRQTADRINGNLVMTGNSIVGLRQTSAGFFDPNAAYNGTLNNGNSISDYIDIDGDPSTFSSSSADIETPRPGCTRIVYAGLYWSATYYLVRTGDSDFNNPAPNDVNNRNGNEQRTGLPAQDARKLGANDFRDVKFKVPGGTYVDITASDIIYDGYRNTPTNPSNTANDDVPYVCYADVTSLIDQSNPTGTYTLANMNATIGLTSGVSGASGGWVLVVVYEDALEPSRYISTADGFIQIQRGDDPVDFTYSGFTTLPGTLPVRARYGVAGLEGDRSISGDRLRMRNRFGTFVSLGSTTGAPNATGNFFDSSVSFNNNYLTNRNPSSTNTLGLDVDLFDLPNTGNTLLGNNQTSATFRLTTGGDTYRVFLNTFAVDIIEPELQVIKRVYDTDGITDITNASVELGDELFYDLEIQNVGNEDLVDGSVVVRDILPANTDLVGVQDATLPPGVTYTFPSPGIVDFNIPADLVEAGINGLPGDLPIHIRFRARLVNSCEDLRDACSNTIQNSALATFTGAISGATRTNNSSSVIGACGNTDGEATNFLANVPACSKSVLACTSDLRLEAGAGYDRYTWSGPGISPPIVTTVNFLNVPVPQTGTYSVVKEDTDPSDGTCMSLTEEYEVQSFSDITNPISNYVNGTTVTTENCSGLEIPQISLCGSQTMFLETNFSSSGFRSISWQRLAPSGACVSDPNDPCSSISSDCTGANWVEEPGGNVANFTVGTAGDYRILAEFDGGCFIPFYFSVFKNDYQPLLDMTPIECGNDGSVTVTNVPSSDYAFSLSPGGPYTNTTGVFAITTPGDVTVYGIDTTFPGGCEYTATINVPEISPTYSVTAYDPSCINDTNGTGFGTIIIAVTGGSPEYEYTIDAPSLATPIVIPNSGANNGNYTQNGLQPDTYTVEVISNRPNQAPNCIYNETVTINPAPDFRAEVVLVAPETCETGAIVEVNVLAGSGNYLYDDGTGNFTANNQFELPMPVDPTATYTFYVSDENIAAGVPACIIEASITNIEPYQPIVIDNVTVTSPTCPGDGGQVRVEVSPAVSGRTYTYELLQRANATDTVPTQVDLITSPLRDITFTNIPAGDFYLARVSHENTTPPGTTPPTICPVDSTPDFSITDATAVTLTASITQEYRCDAAGTGVQTATITVAPLLGAGYSYSIDGVDYSNTTGEFTGLTDGTYTVYARDASTVACPVASTPMVVEPLQEVNSLSFTQTAIQCPALTSTVTVSATGTNGASSFEYRIAAPAGDATTFAATDTYTLAVGTYTFEARTTTDGCVYSDTVTINAIDNITVNGSATAEPTCNGDVDGALSFTVNDIDLTTNTYEYTVSGGTIAAPTTVTGQNTTPISVTGLGAGTYTILVRDEVTNCTNTDTVVITEPAVLGFTFTTDAADCGNNTGSITVTATGGRGGYQYELRDAAETLPAIVAYQNNNTFANLAPGTYTVFVRDTNDPTTACETPSQTVVIDQTQLPVLTAIAGGDACYDTTDQASQWITITPGTTPTGPFTYSLNGGAPQAVDFTTPAGLPADSFEIPNLTPGTYTVTVQNTASTCSSAPLSFTIQPELTITAALTKEITCAPTEDATITFSTTGGNGSNVIAILRDGAVIDAAYAGGSPYATNVAGTYEIRVTDGESCEATSAPIVVAPYTPVTATATPTDPTCPGGTGSILVTATAGSGPFTYVLDGTTSVGPVAATSNTFTGVAIGAHSIEVSDQYGCSVMVNATIASPPALTADIAITRDYSCDAAGTGIIFGQISVTNPANGNGSYEYSIDGVDYTNVTGVFDNLTDGTYTLYIRDTNTSACPVNLGDLTIDPLQEVTDIAFVQTQMQCPALTTDVTLTATGTNGASSFEYRIAAPAGDATTFAATDTYTLAAGTYTFESRTTTDGCVYSETYTVDPIDQIVVNASVTAEPTCNGDTDGALSFNVTNLGTHNYTYTVTNGAAVVVASGGPIATTPTPITGLGADTYTVEVTDTTTNCTNTDTVVITEPAVLGFTFTTDAADCGNNTGSITVTATGGRGGYQYELRDAAETLPAIVAYQNNNTFANLAPGTYTVFVRDTNDPTTACETPSQTVVIDQTQLPVLTAIAGGDACYDTTDQASQWITITPGTTPTGPFTYSLNGGAPQAVDFTTPAGLPADSFEIPNLTPGTYTVTVQNTASTCSSAPLSFTIQPELTITAALTKEITCAPTEDATITFSTTGGNGSNVIAILRDGAVIDAAYAGGSPYATNVAGTYEIRVTDGESCEATSAPIVVAPYTPVTATATPTDPTCPGGTGSILVTATAGSGPFTYVLDGTTSVGPVAATSNTFTGVAIGAHSIEVSDQYGCSVMVNATIASPPALTADIAITRDYSCDAAGTGIIFGQISVTNPANGNGSYEYSIDGVDYTNVTGVFDNLTDGTYTLYIRDTNTSACPVNLGDLTIDPLQEVTDIAFVQTQMQCPALTTDVTLTATGTNGASSFEYRIAAPAGDATTFAATDTYTLAAGTYTFESRTTTDGCVYSETYTVDPIDQIVVNASVTAEPTCNGDTDGALSFNVTNLGTHNYTYTVTNGAAVVVASGGPIATTPTPITGLGADTYTVEVTDITTNCTNTDTVVITEPAVITVSATSAEANCGDSTGAVIATASGGRGSLQYELRDSAGVVIIRGYQSSSFFAALAAGDYTVFVRDASLPTACETPTGVPITVGTKAAPTIAAVSGGDACYDTTDQASQWITITPGVAAPLGPFTYSLNGGADVAVTFLPGPAPANTFEIPSLTPGTYDVTVTNTDTNCTTATTTFTIAPQVRIVASLTKDLDCSGSPDAVIDVTTADGNGTRTIEVSSDGGATYTATTSPFTTGVAGNYQFRVTDSEGCTADSTIIIVTDNPEPVATAVASDATCNGLADGSVVITVDTTIGTGPYEIDFNGLGYSNQTTYGNLAAGTYTYFVRDAKGCINSPAFSITVGEPAPVVVGTENNVDITCGATGNVLGRIDLSNITGGTLPYTYSLLNLDNTLATTSTVQPIGPTTDDFVVFNDLDFGDYKVRIEDDNGCIYEFTYNIATPAIFTVATSTTATCSNGVTADINVSGGTGPFLIREYPSGVAGPLNGLPVSSGAPERNHRFTNIPFDSPYTYEIIDTNTGCTDIQSIAPVSSPSLMNIAVTENNVSCTTNADGSIDYSIDTYQGNQLTYDVYRTSDLFTDINGTLVFGNGNPEAVGATATGTISGFGPGEYLLRVTESDPTVLDPCNASIEFTITEPTPLAIVETSNTVGNCNTFAEVVVNGQGGTPPYRYAPVLDGAAAPAPAAYNANNVLSLDQSLGLDWDVYILDANDCAVLPPLDVTITATADPVFTSVPAFVDDACTFDNNYTFTVNATGTGQLQYGIDDGDTGTADTPVFVTDTPNDGIFTYTVTTPGTYTLTVRDANGCFDTGSITVYEEVLVDADFTTPPTCRNADGEITVTSVTGGSDYATNPSNFSFTLVDNGTNAIVAGPQASNIFPGIAAGDYRVEVLDSAIASAPGCTATVNVSRTVPLDPIVTGTSEDVSCFGASDGSITVVLDPTTDGDTPYAYEIYQGATLIAGPQASPVFTGLFAAGTYQMVVTSGRGCANAPVDIVVGTPTQVTATASQTAYSCAADNSEIYPDITVTIENGTPPYTISYTTPAITVTNQTVTDADGTTAGVQYVIDADQAGNYDITVNDSNGCPLVLPTETVNPFPIMNNPLVTRDATAINGGVISCDNPEGVIVSIDRILGNTSGYQFDLLPMGTATQVVAEDASGTTSSATFNLAAPGSYTFRITDLQTGCTIDTAPYVVAPYDTIDAIATEVTSVLCAGDTTGEINLEITGYTGTYNYIVTNTTTSTVEATGSGDTALANPLLISGLPSGTFTVNVEALDTPFCDEVSNVVTITQPTPLALSLSSATTPNCTDLVSHVVMDAVGGVGPYSFNYAAGVLPQPDPATYPETNTFDLDPATSLDWVIFVRDANNCVERVEITIPDVTPNPILNAPLPQFVDDPCTFDNNYTFTVTATGFGTLTYQLDSGVAVVGNVDNNTHQFTVTAAGTYQVTVYDENGCPSNQETITVYPELIVTATFTDPTCRAADGTVVATVTGGSASAANWTFDLIDVGTGVTLVGVTQVAGPGANEVTFGNVPNGDYRVEVTDSAIGPAPGCTDTFDITVPRFEDPIVTGTSEPVSCFGASDGTVTVVLDPSTDDDTPYAYELYQGVTLIAGPQASPVFTGLAANTYDMVVTSSKSCVNTPVAITVGTPAVLDATTSQSNYTCDASNNDNFPDITIDITGGNAPYRISYNGPTGTFTNIVVNGVQHVVDADIDGTYNFTIEDSKGCTFAVSETVNPFPIMNNPLVTRDATAINGGVISCDNPEGVIVSIDRILGNTSGYQFDLLPMGTATQVVAEDASGTTSSATFNLAAPGSYTFRITDLQTGCTIDTAPYVVAPYDTIDAIATEVTSVLCAGDTTGEINLEITGYTGTYNYIVTNTTTSTVEATGSGDTALANPLLISGLPSGTFTVNVEALDTPFCDEVSNVVTITQPTPLALSLSSATTPNCTDLVSHVVMDAVGGVGPYSFNYAAGVLPQPDPATYPETNTFDLDPATSLDWVIFVRDANNCVERVEITIPDVTPNPILNAPLPQFVDDPCTFDNNYTFTVTATGFGTLTYQLDSGVAVVGNVDNNTHQFTVTAAGTYQVTVYDENGCPSNQETITVYPELIVTATFTDPTCRAADGTVVATVTGGSASAANWTFDLIDVGTGVTLVGVTQVAGPGANEVTFGNVPNGDYRVEVTDSAIGPAPGCTDTFDITVPRFEDPIVTGTSEPVSCFGASDGTVTVVLDPSTDDDTPYAYELYQGVTLIAGPQASPVFTGLAANTYDMVVTSSKSCVNTPVAITVGTPAVLDATTLQSNYTCDASNNDNFPDITIDITGGNAPYRISYNGPTGTFTNIVVSGAQHVVDADIDGVYNFTIEDSKGCTFAVSETVNPFPIMTNPTATLVTRINCNPDPEVVTVTIDGGTPSGDFLFEVTNGPAVVASQTITATGPTTSATFNLPAVGTYNFTITDQTTTCTIPIAYTVAQFNTIEIVAAQETPETCFGDADGTINISITGYTGAYSYRVLDASSTVVATGTGDTAVNPYVLPSTFSLGSYTVEITETVDPFCVEVSNSVQINGPLAPLDLTIIPINLQEYCDPASNGGFQATVTGAQGTVTYSIGGAPLPDNITGRFEGLPAGTYTVTATDDNGTFSCTDVETVTIAAPANDVVVTLTSTDVTCFGSVDGQIVASATGSNGPFRYSIRAGGGTESAPQTSNTFENLRPNVMYTITAYDEIGCVATETATLAEPAEVTVNVTSGPLLNCGDTTGTFTVSGTTSAGGGITTYYVVDQAGITTSQANGNFTLPEGSYQFYVEDANGCESQRSNAVVVAPIEDITLVLDTRFSESVNCFGEASARINASVTGGFGDYTFELVGPVSGIQSQSLFTDLPAGNYEYIVRTARACEARATFTVDTPTQLVASVTETDVLCNGEDDGQIRIEVTPGTGTAPYSFAISTDAGRFLNDASDGLPNEHTFSDLGPGVYDVYIQDANGCSLIEQRTIIEPNPLQVAVLGAITPETCADENDGGVTIEITGGTAPYETNITNNDADFVAGQFIFDNLPGGGLTIFVRDANGCRIELPVLIPEGVALTATLEQGLECPVYQIGEDNQTVLVSEESHFIQFNIPEVLQDVNIIYTLNGINGTPNPSSNQNTTGRFVVEPGQYEAVMESGLCTQIIDTVRVDEYVPLTVPVPQMTNNPEDPNEYSIQVEGGVGEYTYYVTFEGEERELTSDIFAIRKSGLYLIRVVDASGCEVSAIHELTYINIRIPNYFTPNGDGTDDYWYPGQITPFVDDPFYFENMEVKVFDRYGRLLGEFSGDEEGWDGIYQGKELPSGDYWYTIILNDVDDRQFTGHFTLYR